MLPTDGVAIVDVTMVVVLVEPSVLAGSTIALVAAAAVDEAVNASDLSAGTVVVDPVAAVAAVAGMEGSGAREAVGWGVDISGCDGGGFCCCCSCCAMRAMVSS